MSAKRTRLNRESRSDLRLNAAQESHLQTGAYLIRGQPEFVDDDHRRRAWEVHRDRFMAGRRTAAGTEPWVGRRPAAFWCYDCEMPPEAESESHGVWLLDGTSVEERAAIEALWLAKIRERVEWRAIHGRDLRFRDWACPPAGFVARHEPAIRAEVEARSRRRA